AHGARLSRRAGGRHRGSAHRAARRPGGAGHPDPDPRRPLRQGARLLGRAAPAGPRGGGRRAPPQPPDGLTQFGPSALLISLPREVETGRKELTMAEGASRSSNQVRRAAPRQSAPRPDLPSPRPGESKAGEI